MIKNLLNNLESYSRNVLNTIKPSVNQLVTKLRNVRRPNFQYKVLRNFKVNMPIVLKDTEENPNLSYIKTLSDSDIAFQNKFLKTLSEEYVTELQAYHFCIEMGAPRAAATKVNKLKDKLNILGMENAFRFAERHQRKLEKGNKSSDRKFKKLLAKANRFLEGQLQVYRLIN